MAELDEINTTIKGLVQQVSALTQAVNAAFPSASTIATSASAGTLTLPSNPSGFLIVRFGDVTQKVPLYNP